MKLANVFLCWIVFAWLLFDTVAGRAQSTSFTFTLDEPCKISAGGFASNGALIRTALPPSFWKGQPGGTDPHGAARPFPGQPHPARADTWTYGLAAGYQTNGVGVGTPRPIQQCEGLHFN